MDIERIISGLAQETIAALKRKLTNACRTLQREPDDHDADRVRSAVMEELAKRKMANRKRIGPLWWEPHDPDVPEFFGYETQTSLEPVAAILKSNTHTATRKDVYSVRIGNDLLPGHFSEVKMARQAGSEAWDYESRK